MKRNYFRMSLTIFSVFAALGYVFYNVHSENLGMFMSGKLSEKHLSLEYSCNACHTPWNGVSNDSCISCHNDDAHYVDTDLSEIVGHPIKDITCFYCHREHLGRNNNLRLLRDQSCMECHYEDFAIDKVIEQPSFF
ncbi:MAG: cytochrome c3 family protein [Candidatus Anammoxibacter sp.]